jgi:folate-dependent phosphoribosylglycinamide formyltransferase PurN
MALIWFRLAEIDSDARFINTAIKSLDLVKAAQPMKSRDPGIRGGIPGSAPVWGDYLYMALPNWAAKYFIDALLAKRHALACVPSRSREQWTVPHDTPRGVPSVVRRATAPVRVVMLSTPESLKVPQMVKAWASWGFRPAAVVLEHANEPGFFTRLGRRIRADGFTATVRDTLHKRVRRIAVRRWRNNTAGSVAAFCERESIPIVRVSSLNLPEAVAEVRRLAPDLIVHAGAGILRTELLTVPPLGTLNAHMGILPHYRGMNVCEWASLEGNPVGCSVLLLDTGLDTGDVVAVQEVDTAAATSVERLRDLIDEAQIALLGEVVRFVVQTGSLPPTRAQLVEEGRQYFRMHGDLKAVLEARLAARREEAFMQTPQRASEELPSLAAT